MSNIVVTVVNGLKLQNSPHPTTIPTNKDKLTSFVIKLMIIANIGGISAIQVASIYFSIPYNSSLVSTEQVSGINLVLNIIQTAIVTVGNNGLTAFFELIKIIDNFTAEESAAIL